MNKEKISKFLVEFGLSEKEAQLYEASINLGASTVLHLSRRSGIKRTTLYSIVDSLVSKGLLSKQLRGWKEYIVANSPETLASLLDKRRSDLDRFLPELLQIFSHEKVSDSVRYYEGISSIKSVYEDVLSSLRPNDEYCVISNIAAWTSLDKNYFRNFQERRAEYARIHNVRIRMLLEDNEEARWLKKYEKNFCVQIKILPSGKSLAVNTIIVPDFLVVHQLEPATIAFVLNTKNIILSQKLLFDMVWDLLS